jgi:DNA-binding MarR family transcriptional regulator
MTEIETLSEDAIVVLAALRDASTIRREPTAAHPSGYQRFFTVTNLVSDGLLFGGDLRNMRGIAALDKTARGLYKKGLVHAQTLHTRRYYALTDAGEALLARIEKEAGVDGLVAAEIEHRKARAEAEAAQARARDAMEALRLARKAAGARYSLESLLDARREHPLSRR